MADQIKFDPGFAESILRSPGIKSLINAKANAALHAAQASAPVDSGTYKKSIKISTRHSKHRDVAVIESDDKGALAIEARTGNLARALRSAGR
ncbi:hypothetical protein [Arcanobacterium canis]